MNNTHPQEEKHFLDKQDFGLLGLANYKGVIVQKLPSGRYKLWNHSEISAEDVDRYIDESLLSLMKSVK